MSQNVKGFRQPKQPNKKQIQTALEGELQRIKSNQQIFLQFLQRNMMEMNKLNTQVSGLDSLLGYRPTTEAARTGDVVLLSCAGYNPETGIPFEGSRLDFALIEIGSGKLIADFERQLVGMTASDKLLTIDVKFPEEYGNKELANKVYKFDLLVLEVYRKAVSTARFDERVKELDALKKARDEAEAKKEQPNEAKQEAKTEETQQVQ